MDAIQVLPQSVDTTMNKEYHIIIISLIYSIFAQSLNLELGFTGLYNFGHIAFFGIGAWIVAVVCLFVEISISTQLIIFLLTSVMLLALLRKYFKKVFKMDSIKNLVDDDEFIGHKAICVEEIKNNKPGKVELKGAAWSAESSTDINKGDTVKIIDRKSILLIVEPL